MRRRLTKLISEFLAEFVQNCSTELGPFWTNLVNVFVASGAIYHWELLDYTSWIIGLLKSNPTIRATPPQNQFWISPVQSWGWCIFCCSLRFWQFVHHPPESTTFDEEVFRGGGIWLVVPYNGPFRGAVSAMAGVPENSPLSSRWNAMPSMGRFPAAFRPVTGRFPEFVLRCRFTPWKSTGKQPILRNKNVPLVNHAFARVTPAPFVIFVVFVGLSRKALVSLVRMQIRHFPRFRNSFRKLHGPDPNQCLISVIFSVLIEHGITELHVRLLGEFSCRTCNKIMEVKVSKQYLPHLQ